MAANMTSGVTVEHSREMKEEREDEVHVNADIADEGDTENVIIEETSMIQQNGGPHSEECTPAFQIMTLQVATVALGLLCVVLLARFIGLAIRYDAVNMKNNVFKITHLDTSSLIRERDQLQTSYNNLIRERDQLQTSYNNLIRERDQLQTSYNNLNRERDQLQTSYNNVARERDQLQTSYNNLTRERDQLQTEVKQLKGRLCTSGWKSFCNRCYFLSAEKKTWQESRHYCQARGADLVAITSKDEQEFVSGLDVTKEFWTGLKYEKGNWIWMDGMTLVTAYWDHKQPINSDHSYCAVQFTTWRSVRCDSYKHWICEKAMPGF